MNTNDGSQNPPRLRCYLNLGTVQTLPPFSTAPTGEWDVYARVFPNASGDLVEEGDRWAQSLVYCKIAKECFEAAKQQSN